MLPALLLAAVPLRAETPPYAARLEAALSASATARRLLASDADVPRVEAHASGLPLAADVRGGGKPELVLDLQRLPDLPPGEAEAEYALALARAAVAAPVPLVEAEQAARQWSAQVLIEAAEADPALDAALRRAEGAPSRAAPALSYAARALVLFARDPRDFYWDVESGGGLPREAARLTDIEDLFALRGAELRALGSPPEGRYGELAGRRYHAPLVRAAFALRSGGELARVREALGAYDTVGAESLRVALAHWLRTK